MIEKLWSEMVRLIHAGHGDQARAVFDEAMRLTAANGSSVLQQVISSLEDLGEDGWSDAPFLLRECRKALEDPHLVTCHDCEQLRLALKAILNDPEAGLNIIAYARNALGSLEADNGEDRRREDCHGVS